MKSWQLANRISCTGGKRGITFSPSKWKPPRQKRAHPSSPSSVVFLAVVPAPTHGTHVTILSLAAPSRRTDGRAKQASIRERPKPPGHTMGSPRISIARPPAVLTSMRVRSNARPRVRAAGVTRVVAARRAPHVTARRAARPPDPHPTEPMPWRHDAGALTAETWP